MGNHSRLILVPQLKINMRYQEWWPEEIIKNLGPLFDEVRVLGNKSVHGVNGSSFSASHASIKNEFQQAEEYLALDITDKDFLLHCDLSYPGIFHNVLFHHKPARSAVFCHATALNRYDIFQPLRADKWRSEKTAANLYDHVLLATEYHKEKLKLKNSVVLGALPPPPIGILPTPSKQGRECLFCSVSRPSNQKVDATVEMEVEKVSGKKVARKRFLTWRGYYRFLDRCQFLLITSKEETYGYQVTDALSRGCIPIAPRAFSYPELLPTELLYNPKATAKEKADQIMWIVNSQKGKGPPTLLNDNKIRNFWKNLGSLIK